MVIDTSVLVAVLKGEPEKDVFIQALSEAPALFLSAASYVEAGLVLEALKGPAGRHQLMTFLVRSGIIIRDVDREQADIALDAYHRYGKENHPASLNYGDCFSYALAIALEEPLLFKGDDFAKTDVMPVNLNGDR